MPAAPPGTVSTIAGAQTLPRRSIVEGLAFLRKLVRFDTSNPPGHELEAAAWIAATLRRNGLAAEVLEPSPGRGSVVARLQSRQGRGSALILLSHLDVVPAAPEGWLHPPFAADIAQGEIWGRGTQDTKDLTAAWMVIVLQLKRLGLELSRDIVFAATADEEMGGSWGVQWLLGNRPELLEGEYILNEGGNLAFTLGGKTVFTYQTAEKGTCWLKLTAHGRSGHASMPHRDNPVVTLSEAVAHIARHAPALRVTPSYEAFVRETAAVLEPSAASAFLGLLSPDPAVFETALSAIGDPAVRQSIRAMRTNTACPTVLQAGRKTNVIPDQAVAQVDCRVLPGQTADDMLGEVRRALGEAGLSNRVAIELLNYSPATESPRNTPLARAIERATSRHYPGAVAVPSIVHGSTDGAYLRLDGRTCYGYNPTLPNVDTRLVHATNERLPVESFEFETRVLWDVVLEMATGEGAH